MWRSGHRTSRGDAADEATKRRETITWERCPVCGYRAIPRDGLLIHEVAALFHVILFNCDNPADHPLTDDSEPMAAE